MHIKLGKLLKLIEGTSSRQFNPKLVVSGFQIDSRIIKKGEFFVPLKGTKFDGHEFIESALRKGAVGFFTEKPEYLSFPNGILVKNTLEALTKVAKYNRRFAGVVIGLTGSAGKTTTKELLKFMLSQFGPTYATQGNQNNEIGLPLTLANAPLGVKYLVLEMGASALGEIRHLISIAKPDIRILLSVGPAHTEYFGSIENVIKGKGEIFEGASQAVVNAELVKYYPDLNEINTLTFGSRPEANVVVEEVSVNPQGTSAVIRLNLDSAQFLPFRMRIFSGREFRITFPLYNKKIVDNAAAVIAALLMLEIFTPRILSRFSFFPGYQGRGRIIKKGKVTYIDNTYNSNPLSVKNAIETVKDLPGVKILILGDMLELGEKARQYHAQIADLVKDRNQTYLYLIGDLVKHTLTRAQTLGLSNVFYYPTEEKERAAYEIYNTISNILRQSSEPIYVWIQGSRGIKLEEVLNLLISKS